MWVTLYDVKTCLANLRFQGKYYESSKGNFINQTKLSSTFFRQFFLTNISFFNRWRGGGANNPPPPLAKVNPPETGGNLFEECIILNSMVTCIPCPLPYYLSSQGYSVGHSFSLLSNNYLQLLYREVKGILLYQGFPRPGKIGRGNMW